MMSNLNFSIIKELKHQGICDASAAVPLGEDHFMVGNDEDNILKVYHSQQSGQPVNEKDINDYFEPKDDKEADIEGVTELNGVTYWITSHGRNKERKFRPKRHQFFATKMTNVDESILKKVGQPYTQLVLRDMLENSRLAAFNLKKAEALAPKEKDGLNIEGLTATPEGELLIGFRNPISDGKALLLPLKNPLDLVEKNTDEVKANFGDPITLDLGGLGIRSIEYWSALKIYLIIAGPFDSSEKFKLFSWSGDIQESPNSLNTIQFPDDFRPESVLFYPHLKDRFQILSDDGAITRVDNQPCKDIKDKNNPEKYFRSVWIQVS